MSTSWTIRLEHPTRRLELEVSINKQEPAGHHLTTNLEPLTDGFNRFTMTAGFWERRGPRGRWREDCFGQCRTEVREFAAECKPAERAALERLCELAERWHLNDLQAGTEAQSAAVKEAEQTAGEPWNALNWFDSACAALKRRGLYEDRGYKFGDKWLVRRLPRDVISEITTLCEQLTGAA